MLAGARGATVFATGGSVVPGGKVVQGGGNDALDRTLDGHHGSVRRSAPDRGERGLDGRAREGLGTGIGEA